MGWQTNKHSSKLKYLSKKSIVTQTTYKLDHLLLNNSQDKLKNNMYVKEGKKFPLFISKSPTEWYCFHTYILFQTEHSISCVSRLAKKNKRTTVLLWHLTNFNAISIFWCSSLIISLHRTREKKSESEFGI